MSSLSSDPHFPHDCCCSLRSIPCRCAAALEVLPSWTAVVSETWSGGLAWADQETWVYLAIYWKILRHTSPLLFRWRCLARIGFTHSAHMYVVLPQMYQSLSPLPFHRSSCSIASTYQLCLSDTSQRVTEGVCVSVQRISCSAVGRYLGEVQTPGRKFTLMVLVAPMLLCCSQFINQLGCVFKACIVYTSVQCPAWHKQQPFFLSNPLAQVRDECKEF